MPLEESKEGLNSVDKALYYTVSTYQAMKDEGYHCYQCLLMDIVIIHGQHLL